jgi:hypothetical protein
LQFLRVLCVLCGKKKMTKPDYKRFTIRRMPSLR